MIKKEKFDDDKPPKPQIIYDNVLLIEKIVAYMRKLEKQLEKNKIIWSNLSVVLPSIKDEQGKAKTLDQWKS